MSALAAAIGLVLLAGLATALARPGPRSAGRANALVVVAAAAAATGPAWRTLARGEWREFSLPWPVPGGAFAVGLDPLSAFFLLPVAALSALCAVYAVGYLAHADAPRARISWVCFDGLVAGMLLVLIARNAVLFVVAWELMSLAAWGLVAIGAAGPEARRAGWIYLVAAHAGSVALLLLFAILGDAAAGQAGFEALAAQRALALPGGAGVALVVLGLAGALIGIALAVTQRDLKRALAHSSVENLGLMMLGLGLAVRGAARGSAAVAAFGLLGALLHVWNQAAMKGLLFLAAGSVLHAAGTRDLERLGGLLRRLPLTGACFVLGAVAIAGLPPLNGFASEWLPYRALLDLALGPAPTTALLACLAAALLALVGGLAAACARATQETWACGYARPSVRMQYGARSFSELLASRLLASALGPRVRLPRLDGAFPGAAALASEERDPFTAGLYEPLFSGLARRFARLRGLQQGNAHAYLGYILVAVLLALAWLSWRARGAP
jgi:hydrogenase-4 component B